ncbi:NAD/NADP octopine/nopaline dehydrogenase family protein [Roseomonas elaeocarpi]|uniref:NAD/NADP octopine/nopaline dehydrogenase family protein n=1 Tax=Roseomonas elaeocarpi TaxID=907779 RepID=A0ABV6JQJ8_9PROT
MLTTPLRIAVLGAGPIGLGTAALLDARGHRPVLWSPRGAAVSRSMQLTAEGALQHTAAVEIASSCAEAVAGAAAVLVAVPANAYRATLDTLAACLHPGQPVLISGHLSLAALYLSRLLAERGVAAPIAAWGTTVVSGRRLAPDRVRLSSIRAEVDVAAVPQQAGEAMLDLCRALFDDRFRLRDGLVAIALSNANPQNHLAIALCNVTRMEKGEAWRQYANITPAVGRFMEALDAERLNVAEAFGVEVRSLRRHFHLSFHVPEGPVGDMMAHLAKRPDDPLAPATLDSRYVLEDAPFGLHVTALLGRMCGRPAVLHESGLNLLSALYGYDLAATNDIVPVLGLENMPPALFARVASEGWAAT